MPMTSQTTNLDERATNIGIYVVETGKTVREAAERFGVSKSTAHLDLTKHLTNINPALASQVRKVLNSNLADRQRRGGQALAAKRRRTRSS